MRHPPRPAPRPRRDAREGTAIVEFLLVFPAFLVLAMFVLESSLMWADRHIERLAAFEAARTLVAANLPEFDGAGLPIRSPCKSPKAMKLARQAALRKIAIISPPLPLFLAKLGTAVNGLDFNLPDDGTNGGSAGNAANAFVRLAKRWPTAVASTDMSCDYDEALGRVTVKLTYYRMLQTPFIDRVIYIVYNLAKHDVPGVGELSLGNNFFAITAEGPSIPAVAQMRSALGSSLQTVRSLGLNLNDAANFLRDVPGVDSVFANVTPAPFDINAPLNAAMAAGTQALNGAAIASALDQQSQLLTSLVTMVPEALRRIPIDTQVSLQRDIFTKRAITNATGQPPKEPQWNGSIKGVMNLQGPYRAWGHQLSNGEVNLNDGATPLDSL
jgi:hypothetical protein